MKKGNREGRSRGARAIRLRKTFLQPRPASQPHVRLPVATHPRTSNVVYSAIYLNRVGDALSRSTVRAMQKVAVVTHMVIRVSTHQPPFSLFCTKVARHLHHDACICMILVNRSSENVHAYLGLDRKPTISMACIIATIQRVILASLLDVWS